MRSKRCPFGWRKNIACDNILLTVYSKVFQTVWAQMQKAHVAVIVLAVVTINRMKYDERRERTG